MAVKKLKIKTSTSMFGTDVALVSAGGDVNIPIGKIDYDPTAQLAKGLSTGYLFRSPNLVIEKLEEIWPTVESFTGQAELTVDYDTETEHGVAWMRITDKSDATMFAFSHSLFEKWSDEKEVEAREKANKKQEALHGKVNDDGTVRITMETTTLGD
jgi:hypothetical protein